MLQTLKGSLNKQLDDLKINLIIEKILIICFALLLSCRTEREQCYHENGFDINNDDGCGEAVVYFLLANRTRNSTRDSSVPAETDQNIGNAFLVQCLINTEKRKSCDKKSAVVPHVW